jgi:hypothetical protein
MGSASTFLVGGFVRGAWKTEQIRNKATLVIESFEALPREHRDAVAEEGEHLLHFIAEFESAETPEVRFVKTT